MVTALVVVSTGAMATFTITGSIDTMNSDAAQSLNATANTFTLFPVVLVIICAVVAIFMVMISRSAF